jgi:polygalacturonase
VKSGIRKILILGVLLSAMARISVAQTFKLKCNGQEIEVLEQNDVPFSYGLATYKYARAVYEGIPLDMEITVDGFEFDHSDWDISPHSYGIQGVKRGNTLLFTINRTGYLVLRFKRNQDFTKRIVIFIEPPEEKQKGELVDIVNTYKVDNSGKINETEKIQLALNEIAGSGKVLFFPDGLYKSFMLQIKSNSKIHFSKNSRIIADASTMGPYLNVDSAGVNRFILIKNAHNIQITGFGGFDGNGTFFRGVFDPNGSKGKGTMRVLFIVNSKNILFDGILLKDAARWNTQILGCEDITFRNCKMINNPNPNNNLSNFDGWDPDASKRVLIENCFGWTGDDNVAIKCTGTGSPKILWDVEDITIRGCVFLTKKTALKIGTETRCDNYKRIVFEDNDVIESDRVMGINVRDKAVVDGVLYKNIRAEYNYPDRKQMWMNIYITRRDDNQLWTGKIKNVTIEDCTFEQAFPDKINISRIESHTKPEDLQVTFKNLRIGKHQINFLDPDYFDIPKCNGLIRFE